MQTETLIITMSHRKPPKEDGKYQSAEEFYKQEIPMTWIQNNNPQIIPKIIAVVNNLTRQEI